MHKFAMLFVVAAALAACDQSDTANTAEAEANAAEANTAAVVLPPSIAASKSYRCKDNSLVYIDWLSDGTARVKATKDEVGTPVTPGAADSSLTGDQAAPSVTYNGQTCNA